VQIDLGPYSFLSFNKKFNMQCISFKY